LRDERAILDEILELVRNQERRLIKVETRDGLIYDSLEISNMGTQSYRSFTIRILKDDYNDPIHIKLIELANVYQAQAQLSANHINSVDFTFTFSKPIQEKLFEIFRDSIRIIVKYEPLKATN
jgi:hypothetical protein